MGWEALVWYDAYAYYLNKIGIFGSTVLQNLSWRLANST